MPNNAIIKHKRPIDLQTLVSDPRTLQMQTNGIDNLLFAVLHWKHIVVRKDVAGIILLLQGG